MKLGYTAAGIYTPVIFIGLLTCRKRALENAVHAAADNSSEAAQTAKTHNDDEVKKENKTPMQVDASLISCQRGIWLIIVIPPDGFLLSISVPIRCIFRFPEGKWLSINFGQVRDAMGHCFALLISSHDAKYESENKTHFLSQLSLPVFERNSF